MSPAYSEYALEGYELEVFDYLLKPISFERFLKATEKAIIRLDEIQAAKGNTQSATIIAEPTLSPESQIIFVKDGTKLVKVRLDEIQYIESLKDYVCIHTPSKKIVSLQTMKSLEASLPSSRFIRIHNSFIIAADSAKFGQPEINLGVVAGIGGTQRLTRFVGKSKAMDMHLTGRFMDAAEAERSGLVSRVVPARALIDEAKAAARKIAEKSALTAMVVKEAVNRSYETTLREGLLFERRVFNALFATEDQKEGMAAFLEKRQPQFRDR